MLAFMLTFVIAGSGVGFGNSATGSPELAIESTSVAVPQPGAATLESFTLLVPKVIDPMANYEAVGVYDAATKTFSVTVPFGTDVTALIGEWTLSANGVKLCPSADATTELTSGVTPFDYTDPVAFTVWSDDDTPNEFWVVVEVEATCENSELITLTLSGEEVSACYPTETAAFEQTTGPDAGLVTFTVPFGLDAAAIVFDAVLSEGAIMVPDLSTITAYTGPIDLQVFAENGVCFNEYQIVLDVGAASTARQLLTFDFLAANNAVLEADVIGTVDNVTRRIDLVVPSSVDLTVDELIATFTNSPFSCVFLNGPAITDFTPQFTDVTPNLYDEPVTFMVRAQDDVSEYYYNIYVANEPADTDNTLTNLTLTGQQDCLDNSLDGEVTFDEATLTYTVRMREGLDDGISLELDFDIPETATCDVTAPATITDIVNDFEITVTAEDGTDAVYTIVFNWVEPSDMKQIIYFAFDPLEAGKGNAQLHMTHVGEIDETAKTILVHVPYGTDVTALKATYELDDQYALMTRSEENFDERIPQTSGVSAVNYTTPAAFTVYDEACNTQEYFVTVVVDPNDGNFITAMEAAAEVDFCYGPDAVTGEVEVGEDEVTITFPAGTDHTSIVITGTLSEGATMVPTFANITWGTTSLVVTAVDGVATRTYALEIVESDEAETGKQMLTFGFLAENNTAAGLTEDRMGTINHTTKRIDVQVPFLTDLTELVADFTASKYACVYLGCDPDMDHLQVSGEVEVLDYSAAITMAVVAQDGTQACYNVNVTKDPAATDKWLHDFTVYNLPYCFGTNTYNLTEGYGVTRDGQNINVSVKNSTNVANLTIGFDIPETATVSPDPSTVTNFTSPVTFTVTAQDGSTAAYVVTVTKRALNNDAKILAYWFEGSANGFGGTATGVINETAKTITVWVPWGMTKTALKASFTLSSGAMMTRSEDTQILQTSGVSANDYTTPIAYTVWSESCKTVEYFVTVNITPDTNTGISQFTFPVEGCVCTGVSTEARIDSYARRIYVQLPYTMNLSSLAPSVIGIANSASVTPAAGVNKDFTKGPVKYTVTAPDGVTKADWMVYVTNPPCQEADIKSWSLLGGLQVGSSTIDAAAGTIKVMVGASTTAAQLSAVTFSATLSCGATICCNTGACAGSEIDLSDMTHTCVVTAQDKSITKDWTITVTRQDIVKPQVTTWSVMAYNCSDSVAVQSNEGGYVVIVKSDKIVNGVPDYAIATSAGRTALVNARMGNYATAVAGEPVYIQTNGLYSGEYYAYAVDASGNMSEVSLQKLWLDICDVEVADLTALRTMPVVWRYTVTGEVLVSYEETRTGGNLKFVQDAGAGIQILDKNNILNTSFGQGAGLTGLKGYLETGTTMTFVPCCAAPTKSSTGNVITPVSLTFDEYASQCYTGGKYESMLVKVTTPMIAFDDYGTDLTQWTFNNLDLATITAKGDYEWFIQQVFNTDYIGDDIPTVPTIYQGIRTNVDWGSIYGLFTPRQKTDIVPVTGAMISADPNPLTISGVTPGQCKTGVIDIYNEGVGNLTITALYLDDLPATDMFHLVNPPAVPFTVGSWESQGVTVQYCPPSAGTRTTNLIVEYGVGKTLVIPINGETILIKQFEFCENFEGGWPRNVALNGWSGNGEAINYGSVGSAYRGTRAYVINGQEELISPPIHVNVDEPVVTWYEGTIFGGASGCEVYVSTDKTNWTRIASYLLNTVPEVYSADNEFAIKTLSLEDYVGQTIYVRWKKAGGNYWCLDDICFIERITKPIFTATPAPVDFGGVQLGSTGTATVTITNTGISVLKVKKVELVTGAQFGLTDANTYPIEVTGISYAYAEDGGQTSVSFDVTFSPEDVGVFNGKVKVTYGLYEDEVAEIALVGEGLSCYTAAEATLGRNYAASPNSWFKFTADRFSLVKIHSCDPNNTVDPYEYSYDSFLRVYADCEGTLLGEQDDMEGACPTNRANSAVEVAMNEGETVYIFWDGIWANDCATCNLPFYFHIEASYPIDGDVCETAIPLTLPVVNHFGTTVGFNDDYDASPCSPYSNYMDGNDKVYTITIEEEGYLNGSILGAYGSIHVLDKCPKVELDRSNCKAFASGPNGGSFRKGIDPGTYYVIISTWAPPQTVDYLLNMTFRGVGMDDNGLTSSLRVYPNPTDGKFMVSISNQEATDFTLELVNISGQVVYRNEVKAAYSYDNEIDASSFAKGVYYLKVNDGKAVKVEKVVIQ